MKDADSSFQFEMDGLKIAGVCSSQHSSIEFIERLEKRMPDAFSKVTDDVAAIISEVGRDGVSAVLRYREKFEGVKSTERLQYNSEQLLEIEKSFLPGAVSKEINSALRLSIERVRRYHQIQVDETRYLKEENGSWFGSRVRPLESAALYVPGGTAFYPSSLIMSAVPAQVAGVQRIAIFTPARSLGNPVFVRTVQLLGIETIVAVGGPQAVALAAHGSKELPRFDKIVGPGNIYVATAKKLLSGRIGIDGFAGPSEVLILGDGSSNPDWVAADLLAQAEHDVEASAVLCTTSFAEAQAVINSLQKLLPLLGDREPIARASLANWGAVLVVKDKNELAEVANAIATEHLHIQTTCALTNDGQKHWIKKIHSAGAIFFGRYCAESFGDYLAGPSHVLPTAGTSRFASPLGVYDFVKRSSLLYLGANAASELSGPTHDFAMAEQLPGHALAAKMRRLQEGPT